MAKSITVAKPRPDFPLFPHATGRWAKKVRGRLVYFGKTADDPKGETALNKWLDQRDDLLAGRTPRVQGDGLTVRDLVNRFLTHKRHLVDSRELSSRTFADYYATAEKVVQAFGRTRRLDDLAADDFERLRVALADTRGPVALGNEIQRVRMIFKYGFDESIIDKPIRYGQTFKKPSKKTLRRARHEAGPRMFEADQIRKMLAAAGIPLKAMILLGINCGFGNYDVATLPLKAVNFKTGWIDFPRPKTAIPRRCPLWRETIVALKEAIEKRPTPKDAAASGLLFVTKYGKPWARSRPKQVGDSSTAAPSDAKEAEAAKNRQGLEPETCWIDSVGLEFGKLLRELKLKRPGLNFYALRHSFRTVGDEAQDQVAVGLVMGHTLPDNDMSAVYRERINDDRLKAVADHVRKWLFAKRRGRKTAASSS